MSWPDLESVIPAPLRGGPLPPDVVARAHEQIADAWRKYLARRVHGAPERAIAFIAVPRSRANGWLIIHEAGISVGLFAFIFDGISMEAATPEDVRSLVDLPKSGLAFRQRGIAMWRESLSADQAAARWRALGGDEAFALPPLRPSAGKLERPNPFQTYALVRRGQDRAHIELDALRAPANAPLRAWAERLAPYLRADVRAALLG